MKSVFLFSFLVIAAGVDVDIPCDGGHCEEHDSSSLMQKKNVISLHPHPPHPQPEVLDLTGSYTRLFAPGEVINIEQDGTHGRVLEAKSDFTLDEELNFQPTSGFLSTIPGLTGKANLTNGVRRVLFNVGDVYTEFKCYTAHLAENPAVVPLIPTNATASATIQVTVDSIKITSMRWDIPETSLDNPIIGIHLHQGDFDAAVTPLRVGFCGQSPFPSFEGSCTQGKEVCGFHEDGLANLARSNMTIPQYSASIFGLGENVGTDWNMRLHTQSSFDVDPGIGLIRGQLHEVKCGSEPAPVLDLTGTYTRLFAPGEVINIEQHGMKGRVLEAESDFTLDEELNFKPTSGVLSTIPGLTGVASKTNGVRRVLFNVGDVYTEFKCYTAHLSQNPPGVVPAIPTHATATATVRVSVDSIKITRINWDVPEWSLQNPILGIHIHQGDFNTAITPLRIGFCGQSPFPTFSGRCAQGKLVSGVHYVGVANPPSNMTIPQFAAEILGLGNGVGGDFRVQLHTQTSFDAKHGIGLIRGRLFESPC